MNDLFTSQTRREDSVILACCSCGRADRYRVGCFLLHGEPRDRKDLSATVGFTGLVHCSGCGAPGPWEFPEETELVVLGLMLGFADVGTAPLKRGVLVTAGGDRFRYGGQVEDRLLGQLQQRPGDVRLWRELGNLYLQASRHEDAESSFARAVALDPACLEAWHGLGVARQAQGHRVEAERCFRRVLRLAGKARGVERRALRRVVREALEVLLEPDLSAAAQDPESVPFDPAREEDWDRLVDAFVEPLHEGAWRPVSSRRRFRRRRGAAREVRAS